MRKQHIHLLRTAQSVSLSLLSFWWVFFLAWQPGTIRFIQKIAYRSQPTSFSQDAVIQATNRSLEHLSKDTPLQADVFFTKNEISHLHDVAVIYKSARVVLSILALLSWALLIWTLAKKMTFSVKTYSRARNILLGVTLSLSCALLFFVQFFTTFHHVLFPQGNWEFEASSTLIQLYPLTFWKGMLVWVISGCLLFSLFFHVLAHSVIRNEAE